jgi:hypothetical protein
LYIHAFAHSRCARITALSPTTPPSDESMSGVFWYVVKP